MRRIFLVILRPFKLGDVVTIAGITRTVSDIGLFGTTVNTADNIQTIVGNGKVFGDTIQNYSENEYRRVDLLAQLAHEAEPERAIEILQAGLKCIPNVLETPAPSVQTLEFTLAGPVLAVRPYCRAADYWQVYFDCNRLIQRGLHDAGFPVPEQQFAIRASPTHPPREAPRVYSSGTPDHLCRLASRAINALRRK